MKPIFQSVSTLLLAIVLPAASLTPLTAIALEPPILLSQSANSLQGEWKLTGWGDPSNLTPPVADSKITANFDGDRVSGSAGCNNYTTSYKADGGKLRLGTIASTRKACATPISKQEFQYLSALEKAQTYVIDSRGELRVAYQTEKGRGILVFVPQSRQRLW